MSKNPRSVTNADTFTGERIREARVAAELSQTALGEALGVSFQQIQKYEQGVNRLSSNRLMQVAKATKKDVTFFLPGDHTKRSIDDPAMSKFLTTKEGQHIASNFFKIAPSMRATLVDLVSHFARVG